MRPQTKCKGLGQNIFWAHLEKTCLKDFTILFYKNNARFLLRKNTWSRMQRAH